VEEEDVGINSKNECGVSVLHMAIMGSALHVAAYALSRAEVHIDAKDDEGRTALHLVCIDGDSEGFALLSGRGADMNARTREGKTPLHLACWFDHLELVEFLLEAGANIHAEDNEGRTVLADPDIDQQIKTVLEKHLEAHPPRALLVPTKKVTIKNTGTLTVPEAEMEAEPAAVQQQEIQIDNKVGGRRPAVWSTSTKVEHFEGDSHQPQPAMGEEAPELRGGIESTMTGVARSLAETMTADASISGASENPLLQPLDPELDCVRPWDRSAQAPVSISDSALDKMLSQISMNMK